MMTTRVPRATGVDSPPLDRATARVREDCVKIYLIAPRNPESFWTFDRVLPSLNKRCIYPNLSLPTVAGLTPREHDIVLCDENVEPIDFETDADIVGVTGYVIHKKRMFEIIAEFRRRGKFVVVGGPFASLCPEELRGKVDVIFVDEAEYTWPQFLRDYAAGPWQAEYRQDEKPSMLDSPLPRFDLLKIDRYRSMTIQFARGCPFNCEFCDIIEMYGRRPRTKSVAQVMAELKEIYRLGLRQIFVVDDNFIGNKREAKELLNAIAEWQNGQRLRRGVHDRGQPQRRAGRRVAATHEARELRHHLRGHRVAASGEPGGDQEAPERTRGHPHVRPPHRPPMVRSPGESPWGQGHGSVPGSLSGFGFQPLGASREPDQATQGRMGTPLAAVQPSGAGPHPSGGLRVGSRSKSERRPRYLSATVEICLMFHFHGDVQAVDAGQGDRLIRRRLKEAASAGRGRAMTKRHQQDPAGTKETGDCRHRLPSLLQVEVCPDGREHDDVEPVTAPRETCQVRKVVLDPFNAGGRM